MLAELRAKAEIFQQIRKQLAQSPEAEDAQATLVADLITARKPLEELFTVRTFVNPIVSRRRFPPRAVLEKVSVTRTLRDRGTEYEVKVDAVPTSTLPVATYEVNLPGVVVDSRLDVIITDRNTGFESTASLPTVQDILHRRVSTSIVQQGLAYVQEVVGLLSSRNQRT